MRKTMTKEVTMTTVKLAKMEMKDGNPIAIKLPDKVVLGNIDKAKAQRMMDREHEESVTVLSVESNTKKYQMKVLDFIAVAEEIKE